MSNYYKQAYHPETRVVEMATFLDDYYGPHKYGVAFSDGKVFPDEQVEEYDGDAQQCFAIPATQAIKDFGLRGRPAYTTIIDEREFLES